MPFPPAPSGREHVVMICGADALEHPGSDLKHHAGGMVDVVRLGLDNGRHGREWEIRAEDPQGIRWCLDRLGDDITAVYHLGALAAPRQNLCLGEANSITSSAASSVACYGLRRAW